MGNRSRYISRLKRASFRELLYRGRQNLAMRYWRVSGRIAAVAASAPVPEREAVGKLFMPELRRRDGHEEPDAVLRAGKYSLRENQEMGRRCEARYGNKFLHDIGSVSLPCDIRSLWEPARLQQVTEICACLQGVEDEELCGKLKEFARGEVLRWLDDNPFPLGLHYLSAMECGLRIPVLFYTLKSLDLDDRDFATVSRAIWCHAWLIRQRLSLYSSLGNHTIAECAGLVFAGAVFHETDAGREWLAQGGALLRNEIGHQIRPDGGPMEQSLAYHRFVLDLYWLVNDFLSRNGLADCRDLIPRLTVGEEFLAAFRDSRGDIPAIGDGDDGWAVAPGISPVRQDAPVPRPGIVTFPDSGYTVFRGDSGALLTFDHGPLGMPPLYNHGHADALSITFSLKGAPFLVDPGTYRYNGDPVSRAWFKGTYSHTTVTIDGKDQAVQETGFIWSRPYRSGVVCRRERNDMTWVEAIHDGYARFCDPVRHKRSVLQFDDGQFLIRDTFWGEGTHLFEANWHIHPEVVIRREHEWWCLEHGGLSVYLLSLVDPESNEGGADTMLQPGFFSSGYGLKRESVILRCSRSGFTNEVVFSTFICTGNPLEQGRKERMLCSASQIG